MSKHAQHVPWWQDAVIYQVYPRSFADADANGMGDLRGVASKIGYLKDLGVNAVWLSPFYQSPQADAGYDVADYRQVDPLFGTLEDFDDMLARAHAEDIRIIVDLVPNHTSDEHLWFQQALAASPGSPERDRYIFRDGQGPAGDVEPNNWQSLFGGPAWTRTTNADGSPGQWYLHLFDTKQPDLNWDNEEVHAEMRSVLRFWLDRGVDGFRVDVAHGMVKAEGLPDWSEKVSMVQGNDEAAAQATPPYFDQEGVHAIYEEWNAVLAEYDGDRMMVAEAWVEPMERIFRYVREGEMQQAFNFGFLLAGWNAQNIVENVTETLAEAAVVAAPPTWVLSNHDTVRHCSRFGLTDPTSFPKGIAAQDEQPDEALGAARGRAAALIMFALPGSAYIYQGDELTLPEHTTLADELRQDPSFFRTQGAERGRDGCRIPMPWTADEPGLGFAPVGHDAGTPESTAADPWLPQPESYGRYAADQQVGVEGSAFELYRSLLSQRAERELGRGRLDWAPANDPAEGVLSYTNGPLQVLANLGTKPVEVPAGMSVLAASGPAVRTEHGLLSPDAALWLVPEQ
ncbi:glycoside hydrolase family 13 protein [Arthrobacter rhombi]|uniref:Alpha-glucosidase n=1 Tax=Arthrobacter rhombi TaxID=71253 RepID=A0A1R4G1V4_9MICC|nr:glycoside hydrolase family 13 protein [Arthrobacter rhombi]SJM62105.1 Alpha-glucosidase [Arthrobacter rhombi]